MFEDYKARGKQKPQRTDVDDWRLLHEIGKKLGTLPSVRRDSREWEEWRKWFHARGMSTAWCDKQPPDRMLTVTFRLPPADIAAEHARICVDKGRVALKNIVQAKPHDWQGGLD